MFRIIFAGLAAVGLSVSIAHAQAYPSRPVNVIVPFAPGGGSDAVARYITSKVGERTGARFVIENKGGAGTNLGNDAASRAAPDGYTLLLGQVTLGINPSLYPKLNYNVRDFVPVAMIAKSPTVMVVRPDFPAKSVAEFIKLAKEKPGSLNFASGGVGASPHLAGELFKLLTKTELSHVPYRGSSPAQADLIGGAVQVIFDTAPSVVSQIKGGTLRALAVSGTQRFSELPDVPTFAEAGLADFDVPVWYGIVAPKGTPDDVVKFLNSGINAALAEPEVITRFKEMGADVAPASPKELGSFIDAEIGKWAKVIKDANIKID